MMKAMTAIRGMTLAEGLGKKDEDQGKPSSISKGQAALEGDLLTTAPEDYICPLEGCLMTEAPVLASDGFVYSKVGLERWISNCAAKGVPLTSPKMGQVMDAGFMLNPPEASAGVVEGRKASAEK